MPVRRRRKSSKLTVRKQEKTREEKIDLESALNKICNTNKKWLWLIFIVSASPGILSGMHMTAYAFFVDSNISPYCNIPELEEAGWTSEQIRNISLPRTESVQERGCQYYDLNYAELAKGTFEDAKDFLPFLTKAKLRKCNDYKYDNYDSVISQWDLVCDRYRYRTTIQVVHALGNLIGASCFGIISDKMGRKNGFTLSALCCLVAAISSVFCNSFGMFLLTRFLLSFGGVGCYSTAYTLLSEIMVGSYKTWMCSWFNTSYGVGMIIMSFLAYNFRHWKTMLLAMSVPSAIFPFYYWLLPESPYWLISKGRHLDACNVIKKIDSEFVPPINQMKHQKVKKLKSSTNKSHDQKLPFAEFLSMFSTAELSIRSFICFYIWFTVSALYNGLILMGESFSISLYAYISLSGVLEIFSYTVSPRLLSICGKKTASLYLMLFTVMGLLSTSLLPKMFDAIILIVALFSRFCVTSAYVIFALYTSELFPTTVRSTAIGISISMSHVGTLVSPYIVNLLGAIGWCVPSVIFATFAVFALLALLALPDTTNKLSFNTVEEMTQAKK